MRIKDLKKQKIRKISWFDNKIAENEDRLDKIVHKKTIINVK